MDCKASEGIDAKEIDTQRRDIKDISMNIDDPTKGACNLGDCTTNKDNTVPDHLHLQGHNDRSGKNYKDKIINQRVGEDLSCEDFKMLENTPGPKAAGTKSGWAILQGYNHCNPTMNLVTQVYDANIKLKDDKNGGTSETEEVHKDIIDIDNMVAVATEKEQHTIARLVENVYIDDCSFSVTTEDELREIEENLPDFLHTNGLIAQATTCEGTRKTIELSSSGLINTNSK